MATPVADIIVKWSGKEFKISGLDEKETVADLKKVLLKETGVLPERQKLLGLKYKGKPATDEVQLCALKLKPNAKIMMMGTREENLAEFLTPPTDMPEVINDFDIEEDYIAIENREEYLMKIDKRIKEYKIDIISEPRPDKKLLVLDIDYTLFDHKSTAESGAELMRPYLHEFLTSAYDDYDIVIWSATSMKWIKAKMVELGVTSNLNYKLAFMVDDLAMITISTPKYGVIDVKPLGVIWGKYPQWNNTNTIMFDDLRRNFIMNPQNGLKIRPFRAAHLNRDTDRELYKLTKYLKDIALLKDMSVLNHRKWERYKPSKHLHQTEGKEDNDDDRQAT